MKSNVKRISLIVIISSLLASVSAVLSVFIINSSNKVAVESTNDDLSLEKYLKEKKNLLGLVKYINGQMIFDEKLINVNLRKTILNTISQTSYFKMNGFNLDDIDLNIKYALKTNRKLYLDLEYSFSNINKTYKTKFSINIYN